MWTFCVNRDCWVHSSDPKLTISSFDLFDSPHGAFMLRWLRRQEWASTSIS
jgi:hypothetical protein